VAKQVVRVAKLEFLGTKSKPGPELAGLGIIMPEFTRAFNDATKERANEPVPVVITVYSDKSVDFVLKTSPASFKIREAAGIEKGAANSKTDIAGQITNAQLEEIAKYKMPDLNTDNLNAAKKIVAGTAKNMGVLIEGVDDLEAATEAAKDATKKIAEGKARDEKLDKDLEQAKLEKEKEGIEVNATNQKVDESSKEGGK
jgi:large subunit ribosomal protein L11